MKQEVSEQTERLIRVRTARRGQPVELRVHYERTSLKGCDTYRLFTVEEVEGRTSTN